MRPAVGRVGQDRNRQTALRQDRGSCDVAGEAAAMAEPVAIGKAAAGDPEPIPVAETRMLILPLSPSHLAPAGHWQDAAAGRRIKLGKEPDKIGGGADK